MSGEDPSSGIHFWQPGHPVSEDKGPMGPVSVPVLQSRQREKQRTDFYCRAGVGVGGAPVYPVMAAEEGSGSEANSWGGVSRFSSMQSPPPPTLVPSVCTRAHTYIHTRCLPGQCPCSSWPGRTSLPWALALARPAWGGATGTSSGPVLAPKAGCTLIGCHWMPTPDNSPNLYVPLIFLVLASRDS